MAAPAITGTNELVYASEDHSVWARVTTYANSFPTSGPVLSSPTLANGYIYVGSNDGFLYCLVNQWNGQLTDQWKFQATSAVQSSPAVSLSGTVVVAASIDGHVFAVDAFSGLQLWTVALGGHVTSSPTLDSTTVYIGCGDRNMYALNLNTGAVVWKFETGGAISLSTAALRGDGVLVFGSSDSTVYALNSFGGTLARWSLHLQLL